jgi:hypothetical protein
MGYPLAYLKSITANFIGFSGLGSRVGNINLIIFCCIGLPFCFLCINKKKQTLWNLQTTNQKQP